MKPLAEASLIRAILLPWPALCRQSALQSSQRHQGRLRVNLRFVNRLGPLMQCRRNGQLLFGPVDHDSHGGLAYGVLELLIATVDIAYLASTYASALGLRSNPIQFLAAGNLPVFAQGFLSRSLHPDLAVYEFLRLVADRQRGILARLPSNEVYRAFQHSEICRSRILTSGLHEVILESKRCFLVVQSHSYTVPSPHGPLATA